MPLDPSYFQRNRGNSRGGFTVESGIRRQEWVNPAAPDDDAFVESHAGPGSASTVDVPLDGDLANLVLSPPSNVVVTVTHASSVVAMSGVIAGLDVNGKAQTETWSVTATGTSKVYTGTKVFSKVTGFSETVAADASDNTIIAGTGKTFALDRKNAVASAVKEIVGGSVVTNGVLTAASAGSFGTYTPNGTPNGSTTYIVYYLVDDWYSDT